MSILRNLVGAFMPHMEARRSSATLAAANAELVHDVNGDESAIIFINGTGTLNVTYSIQGSPDGTNYYDVLAFPYSTASLGGTLPQPGQPLVLEAVNAATIQRMLCLGVGGLQKIRIRLTTYTSGSALVSINSDACASISPYIRDQKAATLSVTATGAASAAVTLTLPAVGGLRHYIDRISVVRSATAALTASATPVLVTTTNLPGSPALTFGSDAAGIGVDREQFFEFGGAGLAASAMGTATTVVAPVYTGVIWRINASYRLGL
jgi:hypothetical protein